MSDKLQLAGSMALTILLLAAIALTVAALAQMQPQSDPLRTVLQLKGIYTHSANHSPSHSCKDDEVKEEQDRDAQ